jgi:hypothetical protein
MVLSFRISRLSGYRIGFLCTWDKISKRIIVLDDDNKDDLASLNLMQLVYLVRYFFQILDLFPE